jgi:hypothetical protein
MSMTAVIGLGVVAWILIVTFVALVVAGITKLRDRQRSRRPIPDVIARAGSDEGLEWLFTLSRSGVPEKR